MNSKHTTVRFMTQNMTEGPVTRAMLNMDLLCLQEINQNELHNGFDENLFGIWVPKRDNHQAIVWRKNRFKATSWGWVHFHNSGKAERWDGIATPARGMPFVNGLLDHRTKTSLFDLWFLNSWMSQRPDKFTPRRHQIVAEQSLPKVRKKITGWNKANRRVIGGGDGNAISWNGHLPGLDQGHHTGLDRTWHDDKIKLIDRWDTPTTGKGNDMRHQGKAVLLQVPHS